MRLMLHRLGADTDELVFALPDEPDVSFWPEITEDGRWLVVARHQGHRAQRSRLGRRPVRRAAAAPADPVAEATWQLVGSLGEELVMLTDSDAPLGRLVGDHRRRHRPRIGRRARRPARGGSAGRWPAGRAVAARRRGADSPSTSLDGTEVATPELPGLGSIADLEAARRRRPGAPGVDHIHRSPGRARLPRRHRRAPHRVRDAAGDRSGHRTDLRDEQGRHPGAAVPRPPAGCHRGRRPAPGLAVRLRGLPGRDDTDLRRHAIRLRLRRRSGRRRLPARRRRIRPRLARRRAPERTSRTSSTTPPRARST